MNSVEPAGQYSVVPAANKLGTQSQTYKRLSYFRWGG